MQPKSVFEGKTSLIKPTFTCVSQTVPLNEFKETEAAKDAIFLGFPKTLKKPKKQKN